VVAKFWIEWNGTRLVLLRFGLMLLVVWVGFRRGELVWAWMGKN
jgi:hypothetical protein